MTAKDKRAIGIWLMIGVVMIFLQVIIGGLTRLTESGLSITEWKVVSGTFPPLNQADWQAEFDEYKASPQYQKINKGMTLGEFKFIYFWEWFHRLWARLMGFVFIIPFAYFVIRKKLNKEYLRKTLIAFVLGGVVGVFGWVMVASGLHDRPMVSPYRLAMHLSLAILTLCYLLWIASELLTHKDPQRQHFIQLRKFSYWITGIVSVQIILGALVSGMRAGKFYPTWPDMNGQFIPDIMKSWDNWTWASFAHFDTMAFPNAFVQFFHRNVAYLIVIVIVIFLWQAYRKTKYTSLGFGRSTKIALTTLPALLLIQVLLGIFTILYAAPTTPVALGVIHQAMAILLLVNLLLINFKLSR